MTAAIEVTHAAEAANAGGIFGGLSVAVLAVVLLLLVVAGLLWSRGSSQPDALTPKPRSENEWRLALSTLEFNYALGRTYLEAPIKDVREAVTLAANLVAKRALSVQDAEILERNQHHLAVRDGRLVAKAEEERRAAYLRRRLS